jgi:hypothetical protein
VISATALVILLGVIAIFNPARVPVQAPIDAGAIAAVLSAAGAGQVSQAGPGSIRSDVRKAAPLTMKKRMEILFRDKVIERVLMSWAAKAKEA